MLLMHAAGNTLSEDRRASQGRLHRGGGIWGEYWLVRRLLFVCLFSRLSREKESQEEGVIELWKGQKCSRKGENVVCLKQKTLGQGLRRWGRKSLRAASQQPRGDDVNSEAPGNGDKNREGQNSGGICDQLSVKGVRERTGPGRHKFLSQEARQGVTMFHCHCLK